MATSDLVARTGRDRQRYDGHYRLVAGCIPYRVRQDLANYSDDLISRLEVLMISSPNRHDLVFPKGGWEDDETVGDAARREALEEAGVRGIISEIQLGKWEFRSKSNQNSCSLVGICRGYMFALEVTEELEHWPEQASHGRRWVTVMEAFQLCRYNWMREALSSFVKILPNEPVLAVPEPLEPLAFCLMKPTVPERARHTCSLSLKLGFGVLLWIVLLVLPLSSNARFSCVNVVLSLNHRHFINWHWSGDQSHGCCRGFVLISSI